MIILDDDEEQKKSKSKDDQTSANGQKKDNALQIDCAVCSDSIKDITSTICGHIFCEECILEAIKSQGKCPLCRRTLTTECIHPLFL